MSSETSDVGNSFVERFRQRNYGLIDSLSRGWDRFLSQRLGVAGLIVLLAMIAMAIFAPWLPVHEPGWEAPEPEDQGPAESLEELADQGIEHPAPPSFGSLTGDRYWAPLGTDFDGHSVLSHIVYGSRIALYIGLAAGLLSSLVGVPLGLISGFYGDSWIDETIQRVIDILYGLPFLPLVIVLVAVNGITTTNIIIAIVIKSWLNNATVIRGETLSLKERSYIDAARVAGASDVRILFRHILPNVLPLGFVYLAQDAAFAILTQANLAFLGFADVRKISWGTMLQWIQVSGHIYDAPWWLIPPGVMITLLAASFYFIGYSLEDVMNPHTES